MFDLNVTKGKYLHCYDTPGTDFRLSALSHIITVLVYAGHFCGINDSSRRKNLCLSQYLLAKVAITNPRALFLRKPAIKHI